MANEQNLRPRNLTSEEAVKMGKKGGEKSGKVRREKKLMKDQMKLLLSLPFPDNLKDKSGRSIKETYKQMGIDVDNLDNQMAMMIGLWNKAIKGDIQAITFFRDTMGEKPEENININGEVNNPFKGLTTEELKKLIKDG